MSEWDFLYDGLPDDMVMEYMASGGGYDEEPDDEDEEEEKKDLKKYKIFVSTAFNVAELNRLSQGARALDSWKPYSDFAEVDAEDIEDAKYQFGKTKEFEKYTEDYDYHTRLYYYQVDDDGKYHRI